MSKINDLLGKASGDINPLDACIERWKSRTFDSEYDYHLALENFKIIFTCNSNSVENINVSYHTTRDIYENKTVSFIGDPKHIFAVSNQSNLFDVMFKDLVEDSILTVDLLKQYHGILLAGCYDKARWTKGERPGEFKINDYCIGLTDEGSLPEDVENDISMLIDEMNNANCITIDDMLKAVAYFHLRFEQIHPFADGNGRLGRNLINYFLLKMNLPPVIIYNEYKETYYLALEVFDRTGEISGFVKFLKEQMIKTWEGHLNG